MVPWWKQRTKKQYSLVTLFRTVYNLRHKWETFPVRYLNHFRAVQARACNNFMSLMQPKKQQKKHNIPLFIQSIPRRLQSRESVLSVCFSMHRSKTHSRTTVLFVLSHFTQYGSPGEKNSLRDWNNPVSCLLSLKSTEIMSSLDTSERTQERD